MKLGEERWTITGEAQIADDLVLNNPEVRVKGYYYDAEGLSANLELIFKEGDGIFEHSRFFFVDLGDKDDKVDKKTVVDALEALFPDATVKSK